MGLSVAITLRGLGRCAHSAKACPRTHEDGRSESGDSFVAWDVLDQCVGGFLLLGFVGDLRESLIRRCKFF